MYITVTWYLAGNSSTKTWAISSIFGSRASSAESSANRSLDETVFDMERMPSVIQLREPPAILRPSEAQTDNEAVEIIVTKLLLSSYYDIVRKNIQDFVPKAIMHFLLRSSQCYIRVCSPKLTIRKDL
ncbi:Dynamin-related protein 3A [Camellia lanceoleosa]|uniref:Dynamin-related protein 3A n=1 Tax=Camellia lanceoleosa TaxID=1840588 RepID=A0ACC0HWG7_9ERIC|nr:Dynamin-related protein 3A [Camellia lanceoleosa]